MWDAPSLCEGWRTREVVAHMTMPARYAGPAFMAELEAAGGDFTRLSNTVAARDGALPVSGARRRPALRGAARVAAAGGRHGGRAHALRDPRPRHHRGRPAGRGGCPTSTSPGCSASSPAPDAPNLFGVDLSGVELRADDLDWSCGSGDGGDGVGAGAGPGGVRPPAAAGPAGRRGGGSIHLGLDGKFQAPTDEGVLLRLRRSRPGQDGPQVVARLDAPRRPARRPGTSDHLESRP